MAARLRESDPDGTADEATRKARVESIGKGECGVVEAGSGSGICDSQRIVGVSGESAGLSLWSGISEGDGVESERAFEREVDRPVTDHEAGTGGRTTLVVPGVDASVKEERCSGMVRGQEEEGRRSRRE